MKYRTIIILASLLLITGKIVAKDVTVKFKIFPQKFDLMLDGRVLKPSGTSGFLGEWRSYTLPSPGRQSYLIKSAGYRDYWLLLDPSKTRKLELKLDRSDSMLDLIGEFPTGSQPKSVAFTPDGAHAMVAQLSGSGVDLYQTDPFQRVRQIAIPNVGKTNQLGYVEFAMLPWQDEIWVSQMTTGQVHVLRLSDFSYKQSFSVGGDWTKVICVHPNHQLAFVSNWLSGTISVIDSVKHVLVRTIKCSGTPRGMAVSPDGLYLWVAIYEPGNVDKIRLSDFKKIKTMTWPVVGAKRHVVINPDGKTMYISDMEKGDIWVFDLASETLVKRVPIAPKLNTFDITPDGRLLFISSRGENNPDSYLEKGPDFGTMSVMDTRSLAKIDWVWGRNQPTGLAVHPNGHVVAFTDFLDDNLEIWDFSRLLSALEKSSAQLSSSPSVVSPAP